MWITRVCTSSFKRRSKKESSYAVEESGDGIRFFYKVVPCPADRSYGIEVARLAGVPQMVIRRSRELLREFEENPSVHVHSSASRSRMYAQKEIFFNVEREGVIEQLAQSDPNQMTPMEALDLVFRLREKSRRILDLK